MLLAFGAFLAVFGAAASGFAPPPTSGWAPVFLVGPLLLLVPVVVAIVAFARRLPDE